MWMKLWGVLLVMFLAGCASGPPAKVYLLEPVLDTFNEQQAPDIDAIGLSVVTVPAYADDERVASRSGNSQIKYDESNKWSDAPEEAITRVLANRLRYYLKASVIVEPWPRGYEPDARIEVALEKLLREDTGGVEMAGQLRIIAGDGRSVIDVRTFQFVRYASSTDPSAFFDATAAGLNDIARLVAGSLVKKFN